MENPDVLEEVDARVRDSLGLGMIRRSKKLRTNLWTKL